MRLFKNTHSSFMDSLMLKVRIQNLDNQFEEQRRQSIAVEMEKSKRADLPSYDSIYQDDNTD